MLPDRVSNPGPLTYESGALPIALHGPAALTTKIYEYTFRIKQLPYLFLSFLLLSIYLKAYYCPYKMSI